MKAERFILSFIATIIGLLVAGGAFYVYQMTQKQTEKKSTNIAIQNLTPTPDISLYTLSINTPIQEEVVDTKTVKISGKTTPDATIIISTDLSDQVIKPTSNGDFTLTAPIDDGTGLIHIIAVFPNGKEKQVTRTVTYSTESF